MMIVTAHYDNSANNPSNPDPTKDAVWGELTSDEMLLPWFGVVVKQDADPKMIASYRPGGSIRRDGGPLRPPTVAPHLRLPTPPFAGNKAAPAVLQPAILRSETK